MSNSEIPIKSVDEIATEIVFEVMRTIRNSRYNVRRMLIEVMKKLVENLYN